MHVCIYAYIYVFMRLFIYLHYEAAVGWLRISAPREDDMLQHNVQFITIKYYYYHY